MKKTQITILLILTLIGFQSCKEQKIDYVATETKAEKDQRMQWWRDAKFGMFIHWGGYSHLGGVYKGDTIQGIAEWLQFYKEIPAEEYAELIKDFNPVEYNPNHWSELAKEAGMKYLVITSKHHEGLAMWDSKVTEFDIVDHTKYGKDILTPLTESCREAGVKFCTYHSILDWHYPEANKELFPKYRDQILKPQLTEIMTQMDPEVMWFDGEWIEEWTEEQGRDLYNYLRNMKPELIINNRVGKGRNGMQGMNKEGTYVGDFGTPEQEILEHASALDWESCMTMNDTWAFKYGDDNWKSTETLIFNLVDVVSKGGNYLLNIGPDAKGLVPSSCVKSLKEIGSWLKVNGEAIYGSVRAPHYMENENIRYTSSKNGKTIYASTFDWPGNFMNLKYYKPLESTNIKLLGYDKPLKWTYSYEDGLNIEIPDELQIPENRPCNYAWTFKIEAKPNEVCKMPDVISKDKTNKRTIIFTEDSKVILKSNPKSEIHYSLDGTVPTKKSPIFDKEIQIKETTYLKAICISDGKVNSPIRTVRFIKTENINGVDLNVQPSLKYAAQGALSLFDKERGSENFQDNMWLGFEGEDVEVIVDLGTKKEINNVRIGFLHQSGAWIFHPQGIKFEISDDGTNFKTVQQLKNTVDENTKDGVVDFESIFNTKGRFIKITADNINTCPSWHAGSGGKAWIFTDEIMID